MDVIATYQIYGSVNFYTEREDIETRRGLDKL